MLKASGKSGLVLTDLFNNIISQNKILSNWELSVIINLIKGKGDATERLYYEAEVIRTRNEGA